jgi:hypothetical protein
VTSLPFVTSLPPPVTWGDQISISETIRRDLKLAVEAGVLSPDARFYVRELSHSPEITVELVAWSGAVLAEDYATTAMEDLLAKRSVKWSARTAKLPHSMLAGEPHSMLVGETNARFWERIGHKAGKRLDMIVVDDRRMAKIWTDVFREVQREAAAGTLVLTPPLDTRLAPEVNVALSLVKTAADRRIGEVMETQPMNYYGLIQYRVKISCPRLIAAAERGLRVEVDPAYADFMQRAHRAAERLGRRVVRSICGEGGVDLSREQGLEELVALDAEAGGRAVVYSRQLGRWEAAEHVKEQAEED